MKAAKKHIEEQRKQNVQMNEANESMRKMAAFHDRIASVMVCKQEILEKQGQLARLRKSQEYYAAANQFEKMSLVMKQIKAMTDSLTQSNDNPDNVIEINSEGSDDDELDKGDSEDDHDVDLGSAEGQSAEGWELVDSA